MAMSAADEDCGLWRLTTEYPMHPINRPVTGHDSSTHHPSQTTHTIVILGNLLIESYEMALADSAMKTTKNFVLRFMKSLWCL